MIKTGLGLSDDNAAIEELRERTDMSKYSESPAKLERNMSKKFKLSDKTSSAQNIEASTSELFKNATVMTGQTTIGIKRNMRLKESPLLFEHRDI